MSAAAAGKVRMINPSKSSGPAPPCDGRIHPIQCGRPPGRSRRWKANSSGLHHADADPGSRSRSIGAFPAGLLSAAGPSVQVPMQRRLLGLLAFFLVAAPAAAQAFALPEVRREVQVQGIPVAIVAHPQVDAGPGLERGDGAGGDRRRPRRPAAQAAGDPGCLRPQGAVRRARHGERRHLGRRPRPPSA